MLENIPQEQDPIALGQPVAEPDETVVLVQPTDTIESDETVVLEQPADAIESDETVVLDEPSKAPEIAAERLPAEQPAIERLPAEPQTAVVVPPVQPQYVSNQPVQPQYVSNQPVQPQYVSNQPVGAQYVSNQPVGLQPVSNQQLQPMYSRQPVQQPVQQPIQPVRSAPVSQPAKPLAIIGMICGIASLVMFWMYGTGLIPGIAAIICSSIAKKKGNMSGMAKAGLITGIIGTVLNGVSALGCGALYGCLSMISEGADLADSIGDIEGLIEEISMLIFR